MARTHYDTLGVRQDATQEEIEAAFERLRNSIHQYRLHEYYTAYFNINTVPQRMLYDYMLKAGHTDSDAALRDPSFNYIKYREELRKIQKKHAPGGKDLQVTVSVELQTAINGGVVEAIVKQQVVCKRCAGHGFIESKCGRCDGEGTYYGYYTCDVCSGRKAVRYSCSHCKGNGMVYEEGKLNIRVPKGVVDCSVVTVKGKGIPNEYGEKAGDLFIKIKVKDTPDWTTRGSNLTGKIFIPFHVALLGGTVSVKMPTDKILDIAIPAKTGANKKLVEEDAGLYDNANKTTGKATFWTVITVPSTKAALSTEEEAILRGMMKI